MQGVLFYKEGGERLVQKWWREVDGVHVHLVSICCSGMPVTEYMESCDGSCHAPPETIPTGIAARFEKLLAEHQKKAA